MRRGLAAAERTAGSARTVSSHPATFLMSHPTFQWFNFFSFSTPPIICL
jgi:hypothetical protein